MRPAAESAICGICDGDPLTVRLGRLVPPRTTVVLSKGRRARNPRCRMPKIEFKTEKFKELLLYFARECKDDPHFGATKLNKQLFFADFLAYERLGQSITGAEYLALPYGPGPKRLVPLRAEMVENDDLYIEQRSFQERIIALRNPNMKLFSKEEIEIVDEVIEALRDHDAEEVSQLSHKFLGWLAARAESDARGYNVIIPYSAVFVSNARVSKKVMAHGHELAKKYEWPIS